MKNEDDELDEFLRSKLGNERFEFKDEYWQNARILIDNNKPAKKRYGFILFISAVATFALLAVTITKNHQLAHQSKQIPEGNAETEMFAEELIVNMNISHKQVKMNSDNLNTLQNTSVSDGKHNKGQTNRLYKKAMKGESAFLLNQKMLMNEASVIESIPLNSQMTGQVAGEPGSQLSGSKPVISSFFIAPKWKTGLDVQISFNQQPATISKGGKALKRQSFKLVQGGLTYYNPENTGANNLNIHFSAMYFKEITNRLYGGIGAGYSRLHQNSGKRNYDFITYGFGEQKESIGINTIRLDYIELPVGILFVLNNKSRLSAGASVNYLVQSADLVKQKGKVNFDEETNGYYQAFNRIDVQTYLGYSYALSAHWIAGISYNWGVTDITKATAFKTDRFNNNKGLRLSIGYQFY